MHTIKPLGCFNQVLKNHLCFIMLRSWLIDLSADERNTRCLYKTHIGKKIVIILDIKRPSMYHSIIEVVAVFKLVNIVRVVAVRRVQRVVNAHDGFVQEDVDRLGSIRLRSTDVSGRSLSDWLQLDAVDQLVHVHHAVTCNRRIRFSKTARLEKTSGTRDNKTGDTK